MTVGQNLANELNNLIEIVAEKKFNDMAGQNYIYCRRAVIIRETTPDNSGVRISFPTTPNITSNLFYPNRTGNQLKIGEKAYLMYSFGHVDQGWIENNQPLTLTSGGGGGGSSDLAKDSERLGGKLPSYYAKQSDVTEILDGTTPVGVANKVKNTLTINDTVSGTSYIYDGSGAIVYNSASKLPNPFKLLFANGENYDGSAEKLINKASVGLSNVDNTSDADKPISIATQSQLDSKLNFNGDGKNVTVTFLQDPIRSNITSGDNLSTIFGKLMKWYADLQPVAFTGSYNDLTDKPVIPDALPNPYALTVGSKSYNGSSAVSIGKEDIGLGNVTNDKQIPYSEKGSNGGVASLNATGEVIQPAMSANKVNNALTFTGYSTASYDGSIAVTATIPNKNSQLQNDNNTVTDANYVHTDNNFTTLLLNKLNGIEPLAQVNKIEVVKRNGTVVTVSPTDKSVDITVPIKVSELTNDSGFITNAVGDLINYYTKTQTYTKDEVNTLISNIGGLKIEIVQTLPTENISTTTIYFLSKSTPGGENAYDEYMYINNQWEKIGSTTVDLSNYYTKTEVDTALTNYYTKTETDNKYLPLTGGYAKPMTGPIYLQTKDLNRIYLQFSQLSVSSMQVIVGDYMMINRIRGSRIDLITSETSDGKVTQWSILGNGFMKYPTKGVEDNKSDGFSGFIKIGTDATGIGNYTRIPYVYDNIYCGLVADNPRVADKIILDTTMSVQSMMIYLEYGVYDYKTNRMVNANFYGHFYNDSGTYKMFNPSFYTSNSYACSGVIPLINKSNNKVSFVISTTPLGKFAWNVVDVKRFVVYYGYQTTPTTAPWTVKTVTDADYAAQYTVIDWYSSANIPQMDYNYGLRAEYALSSDSSVKLVTPRKIYGNNFDGSADISGDALFTQSTTGPSGGAGVTILNADTPCIKFVKNTDFTDPLLLYRNPTGYGLKLGWSAGNVNVLTDNMSLNANNLINGISDTTLNATERLMLYRPFSGADHGPSNALSSGFYIVETADSSAYPDGNTGILLTYDGSEKNCIYQLYFTDTTNKIYKRKSISGTFSSWQEISGGGSGGGDDTTPIGSMMDWATNVAPTGYLLCDGSNISRTTYQDLFDVIGTTFGAGDGTTTFSLPDFRGRVSVGYDSTQTEFNAIGKTGGNKSLQAHNTVTIANAGDGDSGNLQPYVVLNKIIKYAKVVGGSTDPQLFSKVNKLMALSDITVFSQDPTTLGV